MKRRTRSHLVLLFALFTFCICIGHAQADRYAETGDGRLIDTETGEIWERSETVQPETLAAIPSVRGTWAGRWTSYSGGWGALKVRVSQNASRLWGTMDVANTDCGNMNGIPFSGKINTSNIVNISATTSCNGSTIKLRFTKGKVKLKTMNGSYNVFVDGNAYDSGTFRLNKR